MGLLVAHGVHSAVLVLFQELLLAEAPVQVLVKEDLVVVLARIQTTLVEVPVGVILEVRLLIMDQIMKAEVEDPTILEQIKSIYKV